MDNIIDEIQNYFIDIKIIIKDDDDYDVKIKKFLLKYMRIIGLVLLIILLIIGYYCNPLNIDYDDKISKISNSNNEKNKSKIIQNGGAGALLKAAGSVNVGKVAGAVDKVEGAVNKVEGAVNKVEGAVDKVEGAVGNATVGNATDAVAKVDGSAKTKAALKKGVGKLGAGIKNAPGAMFDAAGAAARGVANSADVIYQVLYAVAIFVVICIVLVPSLALIVIGIICYVLLKDKMRAIKAL